MRYFVKEILPLILTLAAIAAIVLAHSAAVLPPLLISMRTAGLLP